MFRLIESHDCVYALAVVGADRFFSVFVVLSVGGDSVLARSLADPAAVNGKALPRLLLDL